MVMTVECPSCDSSFPVDPAKIPEGGVNARCTVCANVFRVERPPEEASEEPRAAPAEAAAEAAEVTEAPPEPETPAEASQPGEPPATQADTESVAEPEPDEVEVEVEEPSADGDWEAWSASPTEEEAGEEEAPEISASAPLTSGDEDDDIWGADIGGGISTGADEEPEPTSEVEGFQGAPEEEEAEAEDWVFETEDEVHPSAMGFEPEPTEEESAPEEPGDDFFMGGDGPMAAEEEIETEDAPAFDMGSGEMEMEPPQAVDGAVDGAMEGTVSEEVEEQRTGVAPPEAAPDEPVQGFSFGQRDPADKARRLARVLVSDMIMYNPERHQRALQNDTLEDDFEDEISKSWKEYVDQVGEEMAESTDYWTDALNDILAKGDDVF